jgi:putative MATE family efflux protein
MKKITIVKDKVFYENVLAIMLPVAGQQAINMGVNMMDTVMLGSFGEVQLSASSLANTFYSLYNILCMGIIGGCSVLMAQFWGARQLERARQTLNLGIRISALAGLIFALVTWFFPDTIMSFFTTEPEVIEQGVKYLKITTFIYIIHGTSLVACFLMRSVQQATLGLVTSIISFVFNLFFNWVFIFGKFGAPRMEIAGAALGTLIARSSEFLVTFIYIFFLDKRIDFKWKSLFVNPTKDLLQRYWKAGAPALASDTMLGLGNTVIGIVLGHMGSIVVAANSVVQVVDRLFTVVVGGVSNAASIVTGNTIGAGEKEKAEAQGQTFYLMSVAIGILNCLLIVFLGPLTIKLYTLSPETIAETKRMMIASGFIMIFGSIQGVMTKGVLRGGGDTKFLLKADILFLWVVSIPLGALVGLVFHMPGWFTFICLKVDLIIKSIWCINRLNSGKWIRDMTQKDITNA